MSVPHTRSLEPICQDGYVPDDPAVRVSLALIKAYDLPVDQNLDTDLEALLQKLM